MSILRKRSFTTLVPVQFEEPRKHRLNSLYFSLLFIFIKLGHGLLEGLMN